MANFAANVELAATDGPDRPAVRLGDHTLTYGGLDKAVARCAGLLRSEGIDEGDRIGLVVPNVPHFPVVYLAALRIGAVVVPMNPLLKASEVAFHLIDSGARMVVAWDGFADEAASGAERAGAGCLVVRSGELDTPTADAAPVTGSVHRSDYDPAVIIYTSGTTGTPKGATLTHANVRSAAAEAVRLVGAGTDSVALAVLPLFHVFGMNSLMNATLLARGLLTLVPRFDPADVLAVIERDRVTTFAGVPTMYMALLNHPERDRYDVSSLDVCVSGGASLPVEVLRGFDEAFSTMVLEGYGLSETTGMASFNRRDRERKPGSIGVPVGGAEMRVVDTEGKDVATGERGEIVMQGPFVMHGYWGRGDATREAMRGGWFHTGDVATVDDDGYLFIVDRLKDVIIRGGYNVYPREVEEVLYAHPDVVEAAVVGVPDETLGEEIGAAVVARPGAALSPEAVREHARARLAAYKYPRLVWLVDELPKGPTGKILKREITVDPAAARPG